MTYTDEELPELSILLQPAAAAPRRSPRKREPLAPTMQSQTSFATSEQRLRSPQKASPTKTASRKTGATKAHIVQHMQLSLKNVPLLPRNDHTNTLTAVSDNRSALSPIRRTLGLTHVDPLLLPLSTLAVQERDSESDTHRPASRAGSTHVLKGHEESMLSLMTEVNRRPPVRKSPRKPQPKSKASSFILGEASCNDDEESSGREEEEEDTDLSGFIVNDDAELSYNGSSASELEYSRRKSSRTKKPQGRLQRGSRWKQRVITDDEDSDKENDLASGIAKALKGLSFGEDETKHNSSKHVEVIDLTVSPTKPETSRVSISKPATWSRAPTNEASKNGKASVVVVDLVDDFDKMLKVSSPEDSHSNVPSDPFVETDGLSKRFQPEKDNFKTPPTTPPQSPSKLRSPSKLLSPTKRQDVLRSPHRQSMDAFWDLNAVNSWVDTYSPKKAPVGSPIKSPRKFMIWSDSEDEADTVSSDSTPSPCASPRKTKSPLKSPEKAEKLRLAEEKRLAKEAKASFDAQKEQLALDLFHKLDETVTNSQISRLSASTGGVNIVWSKTLRSTAGRANWRRTVTKLSGSPIKDDATGSEIKVQHFASIELATKIIDCESRLVNTLAHEFCHLANFMVSGVRDQPHGASFKQWAVKATQTLRASGNPSWTKVEVTTKHSYEINHKYLWLCVGREKNRAMELLNLEAEEGCGAEYGRHSKSIDTEKHRCGKCKGILRQVRPTPRAGSASPRKKTLRSPVKKDSSIGGLETMVEIVELSD